MEVQSHQSPQKELNQSEEEKSNSMNLFSSKHKMEIQSDQSPLKELNRSEEENTSSNFYSSGQKMEIQSSKSPLKELNRSEEENSRSPLVADYKSPITPPCDQQDLKKSDESMHNSTGTGTGTCHAERKPAGNSSSNVIISGNGTGTPERLKVPKAFKYPERYTSPTDHMISPISKGILARRRKVGSLLPPSINQIN